MVIVSQFRLQKRMNISKKKRNKNRMKEGTMNTYLKKHSATDLVTELKKRMSSNDDEVKNFEKNPNLKDIIAVRFLDEAGKHADMETPPFTHFAPMVQRIVDAHCEVSP